VLGRAAFLDSLNRNWPLIVSMPSKTLAGGGTANVQIDVDGESVMDQLTLRSTYRINYTGTSRDRPATLKARLRVP
jgi:hypothetical protein